METVDDRGAFSVKEAAAYLGISRDFAWKLVWSGEIPTVRLGKRRLVPRVRLDEMLEGDPKEKTAA